MGQCMSPDNNLGYPTKAEVMQWKQDIANTGDIMVANNKFQNLADAYIRLLRWFDNGIEVFASPCAVHSGDNTPPFHIWVEKYGHKCTICLVDELQAIQKGIRE